MHDALLVNVYLHPLSKILYPPWIFICHVPLTCQVNKEMMMWPCQFKECGAFCGRLPMSAGVGRYSYVRLDVVSGHRPQGEGWVRGWRRGGLGVGGGGGSILPDSQTEGSIREG